MSTPSAHERIPAFTIGDRLRKAREKTGLDQGPFADEIGVSRGTVSNYEGGRTTQEHMKRAYLMAWAMRADVPLEWLLTGSQPSGKPPEGGDALQQLTAAKRSRSHRRRVDSSTVGYLDLFQAA